MIFEKFVFLIGEKKIVQIVTQLFLSSVVIWLLVVICDMVMNYLDHSSRLKNTPLNSQLLPVVRKGLKTLVITLGILVTIQNLGYNVMSLLAGLGLGGLAFALAAKDTCANLLGSMTILIDRPFLVGDWIVVDHIEGNVEEIGLRSTRIRTFHDSIVTFPNSTIAQANIDNLGRRNYRRVRTILSVTYDTKPEKLETFTTALKTIIQNHPRTRKDNYQVVFFGYGASALEVLVNFFIEVDDLHMELEEREKIYFDIFKTAESMAIRFAFPTQTLHIESVPKAN